MKYLAYLAFFFTFFAFFIAYLAFYFTFFAESGQGGKLLAISVMDSAGIPGGTGHHGLQKQEKKKG